jgi:glycosidase
MTMKNAVRFALLALALAVELFGAAACADLSAVEPKAVLTSNVTDWRDEVIYQLMVDRFANGDVNNDYNVEPGHLGRYQGGDYQGVIDRLDYLEELGVTALWISPVVRNVEEDAGFASYHGYWTQDFLGVNPHFGDLAALRRLVDGAHARGMKVILDIVTNHVGQLFYYDVNGNGQPDENVYGGGEEAPTGGTHSPVWHLTEYDPEYDPRGIQSYTSLGEGGPAPVRWIYMPELNRMPTLPAQFQNLDWYHKRGRVTTWDSLEQTVYGDFPGGLKDLATEREDVTDALIEVFKYWITAADFDGFRIDTLKHVEHEFWQRFCPAMRRHALDHGKEKFFMFGEAFDGRDDLIGSFTFNGEVDSAFYFSQKFQVYDGVFKYGAATKTIEELWTARQTNYADQPHANGIGVPPRAVLVNFMDNHDVPRFLWPSNTVAALHSALFLLLTQDGIPCLYYGTEQQFAGGNDPTNREPLWWSGFDTTNPTFRHIRALIDLRKQYAPLRRGDLVVRWSTEHVADEQDAGIFAFERSLDGETVLVVVNSRDAAGETSTSATGGEDMLTSFAPGTVLQNVFADDDPNDTFTVDADGRLRVAVPARGGKVLVAQ